MDKHLISYFAGIFIVLASHIYVLSQSPTSAMQQHAYANIAGALLIAYYFLSREGYTSY